MRLIYYKFKSLSVLLNLRPSQVRDAVALAPHFFGEHSVLLLQALDLSRHHFHVRRGRHLRMRVRGHLEVHVRGEVPRGEGVQPLVQLVNAP